jgi:hypothetical protein
MQGKTMSASFAVNGRYLTQTMSGVQRYARNIVHALDQLPGSQGAAVISPKVSAHPAYERMQALQTGFLTGYAWEQGELPIAARGRRLLNLCNMAPLIKSEQILSGKLYGQFSGCLSRPSTASG